MIGSRARTIDETRRVKRKADEGNYKSLGHAAASIRLIARRSLRKRKTPSPAGKPPGSPTRKLKQATLYAVDRQRSMAVIGPSADLVGPTGEIHEHGETYKGVDFPERPFMAPALEAAEPRLPRHWAGTVK